MGTYQFNEKHRAYMRAASRSTISVAEGAVRAGKTVDNVFVFASLLEHSPDRIHLASGSTMANAKLNLGDCNGLGLAHIFRGRCRWGRFLDSECLFVDTAVGERIVLFTGGRNGDAYKRIRGSSYGMWIATEINHHHDTFIREAFNRQLAALDRRVFWDLNPGPPGAPIYRDYIDKYAAQAASRPGFFHYGHFTIRDNPAVSPERIAEIEAQYEPGSVWYRRDILGQRCAAEGLIYRVYADDRARFTIPASAIPPLRHITIGVDFGGNRSRTAFAAAGFPVSGGLLILADHCISGTKGDVDPVRVVSEFRAFLARVRALAPGVFVKYVFCDSEAQYLINALRRSLSGEKLTVLDCAKRPILDRISFILGLLNTDRFHLTDACSYLPDGLAQAVWDDAGVDKRKDDFTSDIDVLDAMEYAVERYMGRV